MAGDLAQRNVRRDLDQSQELRRMRLYPGGTPVAALRQRLAAARRLPLPHEFDNSRRCDVETRGRGSSAHPLLLHGPDDTTAKVQRQRLGHQGWPPAPAPSVNHDLPTPGNPKSDSVRTESALAASSGFGSKGIAMPAGGCACDRATWQKSANSSSRAVA